MKSTAFRAVALAALVLALSGIGRGQDTEAARETLQGLDGTQVVIERLSADARRFGLTWTQLRTDVEQKLREAGIPVLTREGSAETPRGSHLFIRVRVLPTLFVDVDLRQEVLLTRNRERAVATTWSTGLIGGMMVTASDANPAGVREALGYKVERFIKAYFSVNP